MRPPGAGAPQSYASLQSQGSSSGPPSFNHDFAGPGPSMPGPAPSMAQAPAQPGKSHSLSAEQLPCSRRMASWPCSNLLNLYSRCPAWAYVSSCCRLQSTAEASTSLSSAERAAWAETWNAGATWAATSTIRPAWTCYDEASRCTIVPLWAATVVQPLKHMSGVQHATRPC